MAVEANRRVQLGRTNVPYPQVRQYGLGHVVKYARQAAINRIFGPEAHLYMDTMPLIMQSAFEYLAVEGMGAVEVANAAFAGYSQPDAEVDGHFIYQRLDGPNCTALKDTLGMTFSILNDVMIKAAVFNTGMSAFTAVLNLLRPGDRLYYHPVLYDCTKNKVVTHLPKMGITTIPERFENLVRLRRTLTRTKSARMLLLETEINPTLQVLPVDMISTMVEEVNKARLSKGWLPILLVVDNTFPTFANMNPFGLGVPIVIESLTKFICGRGENMGGVAAFNMDATCLQLSQADYTHAFNHSRMMSKDDGLSISPFPAWDILRNLTDIEMRRHWVQTNAQKVVGFLKEQEKLAFVNYPGETGNREHDEVALRLMKDETGKFAPGYMIYFVIKGDPAEAKAKGTKLLNWLSENTSLKVKVSFGQQDTCLEIPAGMTHSSYSDKELDIAGIDKGGIRVAVGWDNANYIIECFREGLKQI